VNVDAAKFGIFRLTRKQFLAGLDLRVHLDANDDLPPWPSAVLLGFSDAVGPTGAVQSAKRP
jgi:hypothetical protein